MQTGQRIENNIEFCGGLLKLGSHIRKILETSVFGVGGNLKKRNFVLFHQTI